MNEVRTAPTTKMRIPTNQRNCERTIDKPLVKVSPAVDVVPTPILVLNKSRKSVEATLHVKLIMVRLV
jgi:hypothetical protein